MTRINHNFEMTQGSEFTPTVTLNDADGSPVDLTDHTARMQGRRRRGDATPVIDWTSAAGDMVLGGDAGTIDFAIGSEETEGYDFEQLYYDLEVVDASDEVPHSLYGFVVLHKETTR